MCAVWACVGLMPAQAQWAHVSVYDNHIGYTPFDTTEGTYAAPVAVLGDQTPASAWSFTASVPGSNGYDIAGIQMDVGSKRLNLSINYGGHMHRVQADGSAWGGLDHRKTGAAPSFELATQWKVKFHGRFLDLADNQVTSPTSGELTDYNSWTSWDGGGGNDPADDSGWLWPSATDAWTGGGAGGGYAVVTGLDIRVERNQTVLPPVSDGPPAEMWIASRVLRRGLQDVQGNYRQDVTIHLSYAE